LYHRVVQTTNCIDCALTSALLYTLQVQINTVYKTRNTAANKHNTWLHNRICCSRYLL